MGSGGKVTMVHFFIRFLQEGVGLPLGCLFILLVVAAFVRYFRPPLSPVSNVSSWPMLCLLLAPIPTILAPLATYNQVMYHTSQSLILLAGGFALLAQNQGWLSSKIPLAILNLTIFSQLALTLAPVVLHQEYPGQRFAWTTLGRWEQWDWNQFRMLLRSQGLKDPSIGYLGLISPLNPPQIVYPWLSHHEPAPTVTLLWRLENGTPDVPALVAAASTNNVVFTVPELTRATRGTENSEDNQYNTDFANQLSSSNNFGTPLHLQMGILHPVDVLIFIRKDSHAERALWMAKGRETSY
jgi:hypothetical protein